MAVRKAARAWADGGWRIGVLEEVFAVLEPAALAATAQALSDAEQAHTATVRPFGYSVAAETGLVLVVLAVTSLLVTANPGR